MAHGASSSDDSSRVPIYATIAVLGTIGGVAAIGYFTVANWYRPPTPMVLAVTALLLPLLALNTVLALVLSDARETVIAAIRPAVFISLGVGLLGVGAGAAWMSVDVRKHGLSQAANQQLRGGVINALEDPADPVVVGACRRLFELGITGHRQPLLDLLDRQPSVARRCLQNAGDNERVDEVARVITERWHEQLLSETRVTGQRQCELARELPRLPRADEAGVPTLLSCAFQGATETARSCCTESLEKQIGTGQTLADALGNSVVRSVSEKLGAPLVQASLHQLQMGDAAESRADRLGLDQPAMQRYVAGFACAYTLNSRRTNAVTRQLSAWLDKKSCQSSISRVEENINAWHNVCRHLAGRLSATDNPSDLICRAVELQAVSEAQSRASNRVLGALGGARDQFMQAKILAGIAMKKERLSGKMSFLNGVDNDALRSGSALSQIMKRMNDKEFRDRIDKLIVAEDSLIKPGVGKPEGVEDFDISDEAKETFKNIEKMKEKGESDVSKYKGGGQMGVGGGNFGGVGTN